MADAVQKKSSGRPMKYPYTYTAKIVQFPYMFFFNNHYLYRYWVYGLIISLPVFWKIQKALNTPENYERARRERAKYMRP